MRVEKRSLLGEEKGGKGRKGLCMSGILGGVCTCALEGRGGFGISQPESDP